MEGAVFQLKCQHLCLRKTAPFPRISPANPNRLWKFTGGKSYVLTRWRRYQILPAVKAAAAASSSSPSIGGGGASAAPDYPEQMVDSTVKKKKKKARKIAGIDQDELVDPRHLADPDSCFCEFKGVDIHYKLSEQGRADHNDKPASTNSILNEQALPEQLQNQKIGLPMILLHGFGASVFSWNRVMKPLADIIGSKVLAFDRPAFGLTSRVSYSSRPTQQVQDNNDLKHPINPYSMIFSVLATLYFIDFLAPSQKKALLVGHSAGSPVAVNAYFEAPERVAALILVAPAIVAPLSPPKVAAQGNQSRREENLQKQESTSDSNQQSNLFVRLRQILSKVYLYIATTITRMLKGMLDVANSLYRKAVSAILRSALGLALVRMIIDRFGIAAIRNAWYDSKQVSDHILHGYTKPLRTKGWDRALIEFTTAMLTDSAAQSKPSLTQRLHEIKCPVLIITGDTDRLVPSWNAERLSQAIPGSHFELFKNCGHLPQEEKPEEFISVVQRFLQSTFASSNDLCLQAST